MAHCTNPDKNRPFEMAGRAGVDPWRELDFSLDLCLQALASRRRITVQAAVPTQARRRWTNAYGPSKAGGISKQHPPAAHIAWSDQHRGLKKLLQPILCHGAHGEYRANAATKARQDSFPRYLQRHFCAPWPDN